MSWLNTVGSAVMQTVVENLNDSGNYGSLHSHLIAVIRPCDVSGNPISDVVVKAPLKDGNLEQSFNWNSPFEGLTPDQRNPMLSQMATSQGFTQVEQLLSIAAGGNENSVSGVLSKGIAESAESAMKSTGISNLLQAAQGRSTITKLNSRQVYAGHEPLKLSATLVFRAYSDPLSEVEQPVINLMQMAYPAKLANSYVDSLKEFQSANDGNNTASAETMAAVLFPSEAPKFVSLTYKGKTYAPLVIEGFSMNLDDPHSLAGDIFKEVQIQLASLQALDAADIASFSTTTIGNAIGTVTNQAVNAVSKLFK